MTTTTQPLTLGDILASAREAKGISIEQAARETKIRAAQLRELEQNNMAPFSHPSYARLFMRDYAKYLGLSRSDIEEYLPETGECASEGMEYLTGFAKDEKAASLYRHTAPPARRSSPLAVFGGIVLSLIVLSLGFYGYSFWRNINRGGEVAKTQVVHQEVQTPTMVGVDQATVNADRDELLKETTPERQPASGVAPTTTSNVEEQKVETTAPVEQKAQEPAPSTAAPLALIPAPAQGASNLR